MNELEKRLSELESFRKKLENNVTIPLEIDRSFRARFKDITALPEGFEDAPLAQIIAPTGGAFIDNEARIAINTIISRLEALGLVTTN